MLLFSADGTSDDIDVPCKNIFLDEQFIERYNVISMNSINMLRIVLQSCLYFYIYGQLMSAEDHDDDAPEVIIPIGAAGSLTGTSTSFMTENLRPVRTLQ